MPYTIQEILDTIVDINKELFNEENPNETPMLVFEGNEYFGNIKYYTGTLEIILYNSEWSSIDFNEELNEYEPLKEYLIREFEKEKFKGWQEQLKNTSVGMDEEALEELNHPVELGGYYYAIKMQHSLWLCSVASFLFGGDFPKNIYIRVVS